MIIDNNFLEKIKDYPLNNPSEKEEENTALRILANIPNFIEPSYLADGVEVELSVVRILERYGIVENDKVERPSSFQHLLFVSDAEFQEVLTNAQTAESFEGALQIGLANLVIGKKSRQLPEESKYTIVHLDSQVLTNAEFIELITEICPDYLVKGAETFFRTCEDVERDKMRRREEFEREILRKLEGYTIVDIQDRLQTIRDRVIRGQGVSGDDILEFSKLASDLVNKKEYKNKNCVFTCLHPELMESDDTLMRMYTSFMAELNYLYGKRIFVHSGAERAVLSYYNKIRLEETSTLASDRILFYENLPQVGIFDNIVTPTFYKLNKVNVELELKYLSIDELLTNNTKLEMKTARIPSSSIEIISKPKVKKKSYESSMSSFCELVNNLDCIDNHVDLTKLLTYRMKGSSTNFVGILEDIKVSAEVMLLPVRIANPDAPFKDYLVVDNTDYSPSVQVLNKALIRKLFPLEFVTNGVELFEKYLAYKGATLQKLQMTETVKRKLLFTKELYDAFKSRSYHKTLCEFSFVFSLGDIRKFAIEQNDYIYDVTVGLFYGSECVIREAKKTIGEIIDTTKLGLSPYGGINPKNESSENTGGSAKGTAIIEITEKVIRRRFN